MININKIYTKDFDIKSEELQEAIEYFAVKIFKFGETGERYEECLIPSIHEDVLGNDTHKKIITKMSDIIINELDATYYTLKWKEPGEEIQMVFIKRDEYGAAGGVGEIVGEATIEINYNK